MDQNEAFSNEDRVYDGYGSLTAAETPGIGFELRSSARSAPKQRRTRLTGVTLGATAAAAAAADEDDDEASDDAGDDRSEDAEFDELYATRRTTLETLEAAGVALGWPRDKAARMFSAMQPIMPHISGGVLELYDVFTTSLGELGEDFSVRDAERYFADVAAMLESTKDDPSYLGPVFALPVFADSVEIEFRDIERRRAGPNLKAGIYKCRKCKSDKTMTLQKQARSADEGMTEITTCFACGYHWIAHT